MFLTWPATSYNCDDDFLFRCNASREKPQKVAKRRVKIFRQKRCALCSLQSVPFCVVVCIVRLLVRLKTFLLKLYSICGGRSYWPRGLRRGSAAARLLGLWVRILPEGMDCSVLSGRGLFDGLITRPEESYLMWCVWMWSRNLNKEEA